MSAQIEINEVITLLNRAIYGEVAITPLAPDRQYPRRDNGEVMYNMGGYTITFFIDAGELDYVSKITSLNGNTATLDDWYGEGEEPVDPLIFMPINSVHSLDSCLKRAHLPYANETA